MSTDTLNRVKYGGFDFDTHSDELRSCLQVQFASDFNDFAVASLGIVLLDVAAFGLDTLSFYLDRRASDVFMSTARTRSAVSRLARQMGYKMRPAVASSVDINVTVLNPQVFSIPVPKRFQFLGPENIIFESAETVTFAPMATGPLRIPCYEGQTFTDTFVSDGTAHQVFQLTSVPEETFLVVGSVQVTVDGGSWVEAEFLDFDTTNQFEVGYNDDPPTLRFGDGVAGNIPASSASISVSYVASRGKSGQVNKQTIADVVTPLVVSFTEIQLSITNPLSAGGGDDPETIDSVKKNAPKVFKTRYVAVTREDYDSLAGSYVDPLFGRVAVAQAISAHSADGDFSLKNDLQTINDLASEPATIVNPLLTSLSADLTATLGNMTSIETTLGLIAALTSNALVSVIPSSLSNQRTLNNVRGEVATANTTVYAEVTPAQAFVSGVNVAGTNQLTSGDKATLLAHLAKISLLSAPGGTIDTGVISIESYASNTIAQLGSLRDDLSEIGENLVTSGTHLFAIQGDVDAVQTRVGVSTPTATEMFADLATIGTAVVSHETETQTATDSIFDHVDKILAADCQANLISVPILARDNAGFYTSPSLGLIKSLQNYLDLRKEVTQTVSVTSGSSFLVAAVLQIHAGILPKYSQAVVEAALASVIDNLLKDRSFGASLYVSDVHSACKQVSGVSYVNVSILGSLSGPSVVTTYLDSSGNLILTTGLVITKGTVTITSTALTDILTSGV